MNELQHAWWAAYQAYLKANPNLFLSAKQHADNVVAALKGLS